MPRLTLATAAAAALITVAMPAHAIVPFVTLNGCPGDPNYTKDGTLACANGSTAALMLTARVDLAMNMIYLQESADFELLSDTFASAPYWDFEGGGTAACPVDPTSNVRNLKLSVDPLGTCAGYLSFFNDKAPYINGHYRKSATTVSLTFAKYGNGATVPVFPGQQLFGFSIIFDTDNVGTCPGCSSPVRVTATSAFIEDSNTRYFDSSGAGAFDSVTLNTDIVPVQRQTWGRLKQLYR
jgi:hypothetical protein